MVKSDGGERADVIAVRGLENYLSKKVQEKLDIYHREAKVLENLSHVCVLCSMGDTECKYTDTGSPTSSAWRR